MSPLNSPPSPLAAGDVCAARTHPLDLGLLSEGRFYLHTTGSCEKEHIYEYMLTLTNSFIGNWGEFGTFAVTFPRFPSPIPQSRDAITTTTMTSFESPIQMMEWELD